MQLFAFAQPGRPTYPPTTAYGGGAVLAGQGTWNRVVELAKWPSGRGHTTTNK